MFWPVFDLDSDLILISGWIQNQIQHFSPIKLVATATDINNSRSCSCPRRLYLYYALVAGHIKCERCTEGWNRKRCFILGLPVNIIHCLTFCLSKLFEHYPDSIFLLTVVVHGVQGDYH